MSIWKSARAKGTLQYVSILCDGWCSALMTNPFYDVVVVGGGPAGLMASIAARTAGASTLLIEKGNKLGRKLGISGGGRCNVTNAKPLPELMQNIPGNGRFLYSALTRFSNEDVRAFFEGLGIRLKEEDRGRVFPVSDKASTVVQALVDKVYDVGVEVWTECRVTGLNTRDGRICGVSTARVPAVDARAVVVATGGCSVPKTGSTGDAYPWARAVGHTIVDPYPTEVPLTSDEWFIRDRALQGLSIRNTTVTIKDARNKKLTTEGGDLLFTHFGLSGPVALRCSHYVSTAHRRHPGAPLCAEVDCLPELAYAELVDTLLAKKRTEPKRHLGNALATLIPERMADVVLKVARLEDDEPMTEVPNARLEELARLVKVFPVSITGTLPLEQATVTGGGVSVKEIDPRTMASKICAGLFFCGEVMDVHAHTGGYNITVAFSTGHLAGTSAAEYAASMD
jgi:predicted Rossmann fold flavoprotein